MRDKTVDKQEEIDVDGLCFGITAWMIRLLVENPFDGGAGFSFADVGSMTPDQIYFRLCSRDFLRNKTQGTKMPAPIVAGLADADGLIKGRDLHGNQIKRKLTHEGGLSHVQWLKQQQKEKKTRSRKRGT